MSLILTPPELHASTSWRHFLIGVSKDIAIRTAPSAVIFMNWSLSVNVWLAPVAELSCRALSLNSNIRAVGIFCVDFWRKLVLQTIKQIVCCSPPCATYELSACHGALNRGAVAVPNNMYNIVGPSIFRI